MVWDLFNLSLNSRNILQKGLKKSLSLLLIKASREQEEIYDVNRWFGQQRIIILTKAEDTEGAERSTLQETATFTEDRNKRPKSTTRWPVSSLTQGRSFASVLVQRRLNEKEEDQHKSEPKKTQRVIIQKQQTDKLNKIEEELF